MPNFCSQCGTPAVENQKFCNKCGAQIAAAGTTSAPGGTPAVSATPPAVGPQAPTTAPRVTGGAVAAPANKGTSAVKIIIGVVAFLALVSVLAVGSCFYIGYKIKQKATAIADSARGTAENPPSPDLHLSEGGAGSKAEAAATVDVPPYPGSTATETGGQLSAGLAGSASAQEYETSDPVDKVESFYKEKFGSKITFVENEGKVVFSYISSRGMTTVTITRDEEAGKTKINIGRIGK